MASGAALKKFAPWEARKDSWARVDAERWLAQGTDKHCVESPKEKTLCLGFQLEHHGTYALRGHLLHPQHFLKHSVIKDRALQTKIPVLDPRGQNQDRIKAIEGYSNRICTEDYFPSPICKQGLCICDLASCMGIVLYPGKTESCVSLSTLR